MESGTVTCVDVISAGISGSTDPGERFRDYWARNVSPNKDVKIYIGAYGGPGATGSGYVPLSTLTSIAVQMRTSFPSFGGVMLWDASQAYGKWTRFICGLTRDVDVMGDGNGRKDGSPMPRSILKLLGEERS